MIFDCCFGLFKKNKFSEYISDPDIENIIKDNIKDIQRELYQDTLVLNKWRVTPQYHAESDFISLQGTYDRNILFIDALKNYKEILKKMQEGKSITSHEHVALLTVPKLAEDQDIRSYSKVQLLEHRP